MHIVKDKTNEIDCVVRQQIRTSGSKGEIVKYTAKVFEEERKQQMVFDSWPEQEGEVSKKGFLPTEEARVKVVAKWSDIFGSSKSPTSNSDSKSPETGKP